MQFEINDIGYLTQPQGHLDANDKFKVRWLFDNRDAQVEMLTGQFKGEYFTIDLTYAELVDKPPRLVLAIVDATTGVVKNVVEPKDTANVYELYTKYCTENDELRIVGLIGDDAGN